MVVQVAAGYESHVKAGVQGRSRVTQLVESDVDAALKLAGLIEHPWYRCQALSAVAEKLADSDARPVLERAVKAAHELREPNRIVSVASWPLRVFVKRHVGDPTAEVDRLLDLIATEPHSLRRSHALFSLLEGIFDDVSLRHRVLDALLASLSASHGWRSERLWGFTALLMAAESAEAAHRVFERMPETKEKRRVSRRLASAQYIGPRWIEFYRR